MGERFFDLSIISGGILSMSISKAPGMNGYLELEDGTVFEGQLFGDCSRADGEVVFNTGMVGYVESLSDPSYRGQILAFAYPLIGNYGVPPEDSGRFESDRVQVKGSVISSPLDDHSHWEAGRSLDRWLMENGVPGISGVDTRALTKRLREKGTMLGRIVPAGNGIEDFRVEDPNLRDLVSEVTPENVSISNPEGKGPRITVVDCGCKRSIVRELIIRDCRVSIVPYDHDITSVDSDGILLSNGPGDPKLCKRTIDSVRRAMEKHLPIGGICLGSQLMALAAGADTYKLPFGHRSQNQPCREVGTDHCVITSQNHGFAVEESTLPKDWKVWFRNLNDNTVEGIIHRELPFLSVQFHPEANPGPTDPNVFFERFLEVVRNG
ncbi:MAG: glutamine-hydrolyzing carbamoyl-phosphate synthase small subunit [Thermoplasmatota archaeon]